QHHVDDECTIQCLEGDLEVLMPGGVRRLGPSQIVVLPAGQPYSLSARVESALLMTLRRPARRKVPSARRARPSAG
ncbi:MAG TPA: hypothetical protein VFF43_18920, partial [Caldimonas sp.]|nr:hypothetical protein [Caldimonas sp.]